MSIARRNELAAVAVLSLCWALALFDITGIDYLMPFIAPNLKLSNTQIGLLFSLYYVPFGVSSYVTGVMADRFGRPRTLLICGDVGVFSGVRATGAHDIIQHSPHNQIDHGSRRRTHTAARTDHCRCGFSGGAPGH
jgi:hypothetical protein